MIKKIILFSDFSTIQHHVFFKNASTLRLAYMLRQAGYTVKQVHHCCSFTKDEIDSIITDFAAGEEVLACISTSFISTTRKKAHTPEETGSTVGSAWGPKTFATLLNISMVAKSKNMKVLVGGWEVMPTKFHNPEQRHLWGLDYLSRFVDYFVTGNDIDIIENACNDLPIEHEVVGTSKIATAKSVADFSDCASTPLPEDHIRHNEALLTEIAAGCIFSCSFCNYGTLGKKKTEYVRSYDSLKREIVSNYEQFGTRVYTLTDNIVNDYHEKLKYLAKIRDETGIDLRWVGYARLDTIRTKEHVQLLRESGTAGLVFGIESFKKECGPYIGKMTDKVKLLESLNLFRDGIGDSAMCTATMIAGLPTETEDDLNSTVEWLNSAEGRNLVDHYVYSRLMIYDDQNDKNDINKSRNNPFRDYTPTKGPTLISGWSSPWGTSGSFTKLARKYNEMSKQPITAFSLPILHNCNIEIEQAVKHARDQNFSWASSNNVGRERLEEYKNKMLGRA